jgi:hypothetical protein
MRFSFAAFARDILTLIAAPPHYFRAGMTKRAKRSMDLRTLS